MKYIRGLHGQLTSSANMSGVDSQKKKNRGELLSFKLNLLHETTEIDSEMDPNIHDQWREFLEILKKVSCFEIRVVDSDLLTYLFTVE